MQQVADQEGMNSQTNSPSPGPMGPPSSKLNPPPVWASARQTQVVPSSSKHPELGQLTRVPAQQKCCFRHDVDLQKHPKVVPITVVTMLSSMMTATIITYTNNFNDNASAGASIGACICMR